MDRETPRPIVRDDLFYSEPVDTADTMKWAQNDVAHQVRDAINDPRLVIETMAKGPGHRQ